MQFLQRTFTPDTNVSCKNNIIEEVGRRYYIFKIDNIL